MTAATAAIAAPAGPFVGLREALPAPAVAAGATTAAPAATVWTATGRERPIFLDHSGMRARVMRVFGTFAALLSGLWLVALLTGAIGFSQLPTPSLNLARVRPAGPAFAQTGGRPSRPAHRRTLTLAQTGGTRAVVTHSD